jgi:dolichol-phosphate mannosyltransferase
MTDGGQIIFVLLAYNEERNIERLLRNLSRLDHNPHDYQVIVVNDGSQDRTREVALGFRHDLKIDVIDHPTNQGVGQGFRTGFAAALNRAAPDDIIVTVEADNTSDLDILRQMLHQVEAGSDVSLASCYAPGGGVLGTTPRRMFMSKAANLMVKWFYGVSEVHTYSSFYRAYRASSLRRAAERYGEELIQEPGFVCMVEVLVKLHRLGLRITEVPMILDGGQRAGVSKMRVVRTILGYFEFMARDVWRRLNGHSRTGRE